MPDTHSLLQVTPNRELVFHGPFNNVVTAHMTLKNTNSNPVCFKIKMTAEAQNHYCVRPNSGYLKPGASAPINVMLQPIEGIPFDEHRHKFMIESCVASKGFQDAVSIWKNLNPAELSCSKLTVKFVHDEKHSDSEDDSQITENSEPEMESLDCKICHQRFSEDDEGLTPRILTNCGHTICENCAKQLLKKDIIVCPFDRRATGLINGSVKSLKKNFNILEVLQEQNQVKIPQVVERKTKNIGNPCAENSEHEAIFYCEQCEAEFCKECFEKVHSSKVLSGHQKVPISEKPIKLPKCTKHSYNIAEFLCNDSKCQNTNKLMCHTCLLSNEHKSHSYKLLIEHFAENEEKLEVMLGNIEKFNQKIEVQAKKTENCARSYEKTSSNFKSFSQSIQAIFDEKKERALLKLVNISTANKKVYDRKNEKLKEKLVTSQHLKEEVLKKLKMKNDISDVEELVKDVDYLCSMMDKNDEQLIPFGQLEFHLSESMELEITSHST